MSDCDAISDAWSHHKYVRDAAEASAVSLKAGTDLDCGTTYRSLSDSYERGLIDDKDLDIAATRLFKARVELGIFDDLSKQKYCDISTHSCCCRGHYCLCVQQICSDPIVYREFTKAS